MNKLIIILIILCFCSTAFADVVENHIVTSEKKETIARIANKWINAEDYPSDGKNGEILYTFGRSMPILMCTPMMVSQIVLEKGERLTEVPQIGDNIRWHITPIQSGEGDIQLTSVIVKPVEENIETNLIIATDRRLYTIRLISDADSYTPKISFRYPLSDFKKWEKLIKKEKERKVSSTLKETKEDISLLDFDYKVSGHKRYKPLRVYNNGQNTIIHMPKNLSSMPVLFTFSDGKELVNYRIKDNMYIVDQLFKKAVLLSGIGQYKKQVTISYVGDKI